MFRWYTKGCGLAGKYWCMCMVGMDDLGGHFQPWRFYDFMKMKPSFYCQKSQASTCHSSPLFLSKIRHTLHASSLKILATEVFMNFLLFSCVSFQLQRKPFSFSCIFLTLHRSTSTGVHLLKHETPSPVLSSTRNSKVFLPRKTQTVGSILEVTFGQRLLQYQKRYLQQLGQRISSCSLLLLLVVNFLTSTISGLPICARFATVLQPIHKAHHLALREPNTSLVLHTPSHRSEPDREHLTL